MPPVDWQTVAAIGLITWAGVHVTRAAVRTLAARQGAKACGSCGTCDATKSPSPGPSAKPFVSLDALQPRR
jgi:hypothetical protein